MVFFQETNGNVAGGGVSVYYSHALQLLFFSYSQGKLAYVVWIHILDLI